MTITAHLTFHGDQSTGSPVAYEVCGRRWTQGTPKIAWVGRAVDVQLPDPGVYSVRVFVPLGGVQQYPFCVSESEPAQFRIRLLESESPLFQTSKYCSNAPWSFRIRLWERGVRKWDKWAISPVRDWFQENCSESTRFAVSCKRLGNRRLLEFGDGKTAGWFVVLPPVARLVALFVPARRDGRLSAPFELFIQTESGVDTLVGYWADGAMHAAAALVDDSSWVAALPSQMRPTAAVVAGYCLRRRGQSIMGLPPILREACVGSNEFSDTQVLEAWEEATSDSPNWVNAQERLLQAVNQGLPAYTTGLRLLFDGLREVLDQGDTPREDTVRDAIEFIRPFARTADWGAIHCTFRGVSPEQPTTQDVPAEFDWKESVELNNEGIHRSPHRSPANGEGSYSSPPTSGVPRWPKVESQPRLEGSTMEHAGSLVSSGSKRKHGPPKRRWLEPILNMELALVRWGGALCCLAMIVVIAYTYLATTLPIGNWEQRKILIFVAVWGGVLVLLGVSLMNRLDKQERVLRRNKSRALNRPATLSDWE